MLSQAIALTGIFTTLNESELKSRKPDKRLYGASSVFVQELLKTPGCQF
jgi:hypothetical protein